MVISWIKKNNDNPATATCIFMLYSVLMLTMCLCYLPYAKLFLWQGVKWFNTIATKTKIHNKITTKTFMDVKRKKSHSTNRYDKVRYEAKTLRLICNCTGSCRNWDGEVDDCLEGVEEDRDFTAGEKKQAACLKSLESMYNLSKDLPN